MLLLWKRVSWVETNSSPKRPCKIFWTLSSLEKEYWAFPYFALQQGIIFGLMWLEKSEHGRMSYVVSGMVKITNYFSRTFIDLINISSFAGENSIELYCFPHNNWASKLLHYWWILRSFFLFSFQLLFSNFVDLNSLNKTKLSRKGIIPKSFFCIY